MWRALFGWLLGSDSVLVVALWNVYYHNILFNSLLLLGKDGLYLRRTSYLKVIIQMQHRQAWAVSLFRSSRQPFYTIPRIQTERKYFCNESNQRINKTAHNWAARAVCIWSWASLEKPPVVQLLKNFPTYYGTRRFITVFTTTLLFSLSCARWIESIPPHSISPRWTLILSCHLRIRLPNGLFPSGFPTNILYAFLFSPFVLHALPISFSLTWSF
jgi:hypothetical protein